MKKRIVSVSLATLLALSTFAMPVSASNVYEPTNKDAKIISTYSSAYFGCVTYTVRETLKNKQYYGARFYDRNTKEWVSDVIELLPTRPGIYLYLIPSKYNDPDIAVSISVYKNAAKDKNNEVVAN